MGPVIRNVIRDCIRPVMGDEALVSRLLLDKFTGAAAAYSLETLSVDTDNVVRVRRSSDDTEQDFNATEVVNGTLTGFCGAGDGFVTTWYDQSGNDRDAVQATAANQPQIVSAGALVTRNGKAAISYDGTNDLLEFTGVLQACDASTGAFSAFAVQDYTTTAGAQVSIAADLDTRIGQMIRQNAGTFESLVFDTVNAETTDTGVAAATGILYLASTLFDGSTLEIFANNATNGATTQTGTTQTGTTSGVQIGARTTSSGILNGTLLSAILYPSDQSANRATIEAKLADIYGITLA